MNGKTLSVAGCILIVIGLSILRLRESHELADVIFTLGLAAIEFAVVLCLWRIGSSHQEKIRAWLPYDADKRRLEKTREHIEELSAACKEHTAYVSGRNRFCDLYDQGKLKEILTKLMLAKYHEVIQENDSWIKGVGPKPELNRRVR